MAMTPARRVSMWGYCSITHVPFAVRLAPPCGSRLGSSDCSWEQLEPAIRVAGKCNAGDLFGGLAAYSRDPWGSDLVAEEEQLHEQAHQHTCWYF